MLIRFCVENFLSFKEEVEFSMVAGRSRKHPDHVVKVRDLRLLKTGAIFGANASGKTNLIKAMSFAQEFITSGLLKTEYLELTPFLLDSASAEKPSKFLFEIQCGIGQCFEYTFVVDMQRVHRESLYEILPASTRMMFERETDSQGHTNLEIGEVNVLVTNDEEPFDFVRPFRPNELFLTADNTFGRETYVEGRIFVRQGDYTHRVSNENSNENGTLGNRPESRIAFLNIIYDWFSLTLAPIFTDSVPATGIPIGLMKPSELQRRYLEILDKLDLGIDEIGLKEIRDFDAELHLSDEFKDAATRYVKQLESDTDQRAVFYNYRRESYLFADANADFLEYKMATIHNVRDADKKIYFDLSMESDGTRRLLKIVPALFGLLSDDADYVFVLDELDRSLHTQLSYKLLELFLENSANRRNQLIATSHDTSLMDLDLLRRDEIWFLEKDKRDVSSLYSLEDYDLPKDINVEESYLGGRLGAIPVLSSYDKLKQVE